MESTNLNSSESDDARFVALLREIQPAPLPDRGFSLQVLAALPVRRRRVMAWTRWLLPVLAGIGGTIVAFSGEENWNVSTILAQINHVCATATANASNPAYTMILVVGVVLFAVNDLVSETN